MAVEGPTCKQIVEGMPARFNPEAAGDWKAVIQLKFSGPKGGDYYVRIENKTCTVAEGIYEHPTATVVTSDQVWLGMIAKTIDPQMAIMTSQVQVSGNFGDLLKLRNPVIFRQ